MADRCLLVTWGEVVRGREERALENFNEVLGYYGRLQQEGRIERFDTVLCEPNGSAQQLAAAKEEDEFQRILAESSLIVDDLRLIEGVCNEGVAQGVVGVGARMPAGARAGERAPADVELHGPQ